MVKINFGVPPPKKKEMGAYKNFLSKMKKIKVVLNFLKWRDNLLKMIFGFFDPPPKKKEKKECIPYLVGGYQNLTLHILTLGQCPRANYVLEVNL